MNRREFLVASAAAAIASAVPVTQITTALPRGIHEVVRKTSWHEGATTIRQTEYVYFRSNGQGNVWELTEYGNRVPDWMMEA